jgi:hypothetical protein
MLGHRTVLVLSLVAIGPGNAAELTVPTKTEAIEKTQQQFKSPLVAIGPTHATELTVPTKTEAIEKAQQQLASSPSIIIGTLPWTFQLELPRRPSPEKRGNSEGPVVLPAAWIRIKMAQDAASQWAAIHQAFDGKERLTPPQASCQLFWLRHLYADSDNHPHVVLYET